ncbi:MAG: 1-acyl-sn-glycerol-3-phosphate acyltransferase [Chitinophagales bacterium]|nr:1-acyl-sn-glycerol-3-phosphate acyltransferase [Chitinophagales bacterium]
MLQFEDRPYLLPDEQVPEALRELLSYPPVLAGVRQFMSEPMADYILSQQADIQSITDFQAKIIYRIMRAIEKASIENLSTSGLENLSPDKRYLFISNHRDIVLDSAFLNTVLFAEGFKTSQIAIGDNLMRHRISELLFRLNKSFVVKRSGSPIELYRYSVQMSEYIRDTILSGTDSVWIAQREGRAKDGNDRTQAALLKMISLASGGDVKNYFRELSVVPVAISYEIDPCGVLKAQEFLNKQRDPEYKKSFQEDVAYMMLGIQGHKGRVHFHFGKPLDTELEQLDAAPNAKKQLEMLAEIIDQAIFEGYALHPINYLAYDLLMGAERFADQYSGGLGDTLRHFFETQSAQLQHDEAGLGRNYLLGIYANAVANHLNIEALPNNA